APLARARSSRGEFRGLSTLLVGATPALPSSNPGDAGVAPTTFRSYGSSFQLPASEIPPRPRADRRDRTGRRVRVPQAPVAGAHGGAARGGTPRRGGGGRRARLPTARAVPAAAPGRHRAAARIRPRPSA